MVLFLRKKNPAPAPQPGYVPVDLVQRMAASGMPESDIYARLSGQGFSPSQIDNAMREALKAQISAPPMRQSQQFMAPPVPMSPEAEVETEMPVTPTMEFPGRPMMAPPAPQYPTEQRMPSPYPQRSAMPPQRPLGFMPPEAVRMQRQDIGVPPERLIRAETRPVQYSSAPSEEEMITGRQPKRIPEAPSEITVEEIVEGIVADYWSEFEERLTNFEKRDIMLQAQIQDLKRSMTEMENRLKSKEVDMVTRLEGMSESMTGIQGRIGSIEKIFRDFLPQMSENVRSMTDAVEKIRGGK